MYEIAVNTSRLLHVCAQSLNSSKAIVKQKPKSFSIILDYFSLLLLKGGKLVRSLLSDLKVFSSIPVLSRLEYLCDLLFRLRLVHPFNTTETRDKHRLHRPIGYPNPYYIYTTKQRD